MFITRRYLAAVAAATALALAAAPVAGAASNPVECRESGAAKVCQKQGHASLHAEPTVRNPSGLFSSPWLPGYGKGLLPPLIALD